MSLQICRWALAFIWIYQGLVPKWLGPHPDEIALNVAAGFTPEQAVLVARAGGTLEIALGLLILVAYRWRPVYAGAALLIVVLHGLTTVVAPAYLMGAFNAMSINVAIVALCLVALGELAPRQARTEDARLAP